MNPESEGKAAAKAWDVAVIGGGPAGMMAAGRAAERGLSVILLEKNPGVGAKLLITGGGRCNVTNDRQDVRAFLEKYRENGKFLFSAFSQFSVKDALEFFNSRGMETKVENEGRVFPVSDSAQSVWDVLVECMKKGGVTVKADAAVKEFIRSEDGSKIEAVKIAGGDTIRAKHFILATGGTSRPETGSTGDGFGWLRDLGHTVIPSDPSLVPVAIADRWVKKLSGLTRPAIKLTTYQNGAKQQSHKGKLLFAHFGISGPTVLNMSRDIGELLKYGEVTIRLDLLPALDYGALNLRLQELFNAEPKKKFRNSIGALVAGGLADIILELSKISADKTCNEVSREERLALVQVLKSLPMQAEGLLGADKAVVSSGGVALEEVDFKTMQSKRIPNLILVGDILNVDRPSGGYSLQLCWTTGFVAGSWVGA